MSKSRASAPTADLPRKRPATLSEQVREQNEMRQFEEQYMRMLTQTAIQRFAASGTVPPADTQESLLEACSSAAARFQNSVDDEEENEADDNNEKDTKPASRSATATATTAAAPSSSFAGFFRRPLALDESLLSPEEAERLHAKEMDLWYLLCPSRLKKFLVQQQQPQKQSQEQFAAKKATNAAMDLDIFCDVVIRLPVIGAGPEEVMSFCAPFGRCEYQGPCYSRAMKEKRNRMKKEQQQKEQQRNGDDAVEQDVNEEDDPREFCHIVHFHSGADAVKCFVELNGYYLDPKECQDSLDRIVAAAVKSSADQRDREESKRRQRENSTRKKSNSNNDDGDDADDDDKARQQQQQQRDKKRRDREEDAATAEFINSIPKALSELHIENGEKFHPDKDDYILRCWSSRLIFVTCDFFRAAFYNKRQLAKSTPSSTFYCAEFIPRAEMSRRSCFEDPASEDDADDKKTKGSSSSSPSLWSRWFPGSNKAAAVSTSTARNIPANWNPADIVCRRLKMRARELIRVFPLVASHKDIEWVGMCRAANTVSMFIPIPTPPSPTVGNSNNTMTPEEREQYQPWFITLKALRRCNVNVVALFRAIDAATDVDDLLESSRRFALRSTPIEPPSPKRKREDVVDADDTKQNSKQADDAAAATLPGILPTFRQMFSGFFSPDPAHQTTNRIVEAGAFALFVIVAIWAIVVIYGMLTQPKLRFLKPPPAGEGGSTGDL